MKAYQLSYQNKYNADGDFDLIVVASHIGRAMGAADRELRKRFGVKQAVLERSVLLRSITTLGRKVIVAT
jgi:hypothetical protein